MWKCYCKEIMEGQAQPLHAIMWAADALAHPESNKAQCLISTGAAHAAAHYLGDNNLGLLLVSGMTREQYELQVLRLIGLEQSKWNEWRTI